MLDAARDGTGSLMCSQQQAQALIAKRKLVRVLADWCPGLSRLLPVLSKPPSAPRSLARLRPRFHEGVREMTSARAERVIRKRKRLTRRDANAKLSRCAHDGGARP